MSEKINSERINSEKINSEKNNSNEVPGQSCQEGNNIVHLCGRIVSEPTLSHEVYGEKYYRICISVPRLSGREDVLPLTISERLLGTNTAEVGDHVYVRGQYRSYNNVSNIGSRLILTVFVKEIYTYPENADTLDEINQNQIYLNGFICKPPTYRMTPLNREISDILLAVNRPYKKSDYIPCIAWGRNARYADTLPVGTNIKVYGRIQSREYRKKISDTQTVDKTAYEVSLSRIEIAT